MSKYRQHTKLALLFVAPQCIVTIVFFIWPLIEALKQSVLFGDAFGLHTHFAGIANYTYLFSDPSFIRAAWVTLLLAFFITLITLSLGLLLALLVANRTKSQGIYKSLLLWPYAVAPAVAAILWRFICQPNVGWLAEGLAYFNINFNYLIHPKQALIVIIFTASWQQFSYNFLFFLAALKAIPQAILDAATLDGATGWYKFWHIILPLLAPTTFFLFVTNVIYACFDTFGIIDVMTNGGPGTSTTTLIYKIYKDGFVGMDLGSSAAQSILLWIMVLILTAIQFRFIGDKVHYK